jgi:MEKHLA domain
MNEPWNLAEAAGHAELLARSLKQWTGRALLPAAVPAAERARWLFGAPFVLVSHGTEADPVLNYGNAAALQLWELPWEDFTRTPSRLTAEAPERGERERLLAQVTARGFIDDYSGTRISSRGRRFRIAQATVWNLVTPAGQPAGQAAMFSRWEYL